MTRELDRMMRKAYADVAGLAAREGLDLRTAAFVLAIKRVGRAAASRRDVGKHLPKGMLSD